MVDPGEGPRAPSPAEPLSELPCATCATPLDPLRAARVAIFDDRFRYFCSEGCRAGYDPALRRTPLPSPRRTPRAGEVRSADPEPHLTGSRAHRAVVALAEVEGGAPMRLGRDRGREPVAEDPDAPDRDAEAVGIGADLPAPTDVGSILIGIAVVAGLLAVALALAGPSPIALTVRVILVLVAAGSFLAHAFTTERDPADLHPIASSVAPALAAAAVLTARILGHADTSQAASFAGVLVGSLAAVAWLVDRAGHPVAVERARLRESLSVVAHRISGNEVTETPADDLRPGEEIVIEAGEVVPADSTVLAGQAVVEPWLGATSAAIRDEGDSLVAGARVTEGRLRASTVWTGSDRAFMRLTHDPRRRADVLAPLALVARSLAIRGSTVAAVLAALVAYSSDKDLLTIVLYTAAAQAVLANRAVAQIVSIHVAETILAALARGVVFRTAEALDHAGRTSTAAFCARGTLLLDEPEVAGIEAFGGFEPEQVLALVAGAESGAQHPMAVAVQRASRARGVRPDGVRSPVPQPGLGVTAVAANGQPLVVGTRGLMLRERISVALAEGRIVDLEAMGRTVILVALGGKLVGLVGLQDGLRPGARAAVQHLLDARIEPVLLSGDTRETCEALGRAVDIDHIRPEILPAERGAEIRRLADGGATVAVLGRSPTDDLALSAADVAVALDAAGSSSAEWGIQLASDDVRDGAFALRLAHSCRRQAISGLLFTTVPAAATLLLVLVGLLPLPAPAVASVGGTAIALSRLRQRR